MRAIGTARTSLNSTAPNVAYLPGTNGGLLEDAPEFKTRSVTSSGVGTNGSGTGGGTTTVVAGGGG